MPAEPQSTVANESFLAEMHPGLTRELGQVLEQQDPDTEAPTAPEEPVTLETEALLRDAVRVNASDIHLDPLREGAVIRLRIDGAVVNSRRLDSAQTLQLGNQLKNLVAINPIALLTLEEGRASHTVADQPVDLRITCVPCINGEKITVRLLSPEQTRRQISDLGLGDHDLANFRDWIDQVHGMLLVAGPTGSGKTTTLYALLQQLRGRERSFITLEDPVEYELEGISQVQVDPERGLDFATGVQALLRLDPDYLMIGEIRDRRSAQAAMDATVSGHALMATLHSFDAVSAMTMLQNYDLEPHDLGTNVEMVVSQRLVRTLCPACREAHPPHPEDRTWYQALEREVPAQLHYPRGCEQCGGMGYRGRTGLFEVWRLTDSDRVLLLKGPDERELRQHLRERQQRFLIDDALEKIALGLTTVEECRILTRMRMGRQAH